MIDIIILIFTLVLVGVAFNLKAKNDRIKRREELSRERLATLREGNIEEETKELIGEEAYERMTRMIDDILSTHRGEQCIALDLTCGPNTKFGSDELHSLLPGMKLNLVVCNEGGVECIDVYHNGARVGRFALTQAELVRETMRTNNIRGVYVSEQNCYGLEDRLQLSVIIFYKPMERPAVHSLIQNTRIEKHSKRISEMNLKDVCQN